MIRLLTLLFLGCQYVAIAQSPSTAERIRKSLTQFYELYPQEKALLVTDCNVYLPGEILWFKFYLWNNQNPGLLTNAAWVVLRNTTGRTILQQRVHISDEEAHGDIVLPDTLSGGIYSLEVYSKWMANFSAEPLATRAILVGNGVSSDSIRSTGMAPGIVVEGGSFSVNAGENKLALFTGGPHPQFFSFALFNSAGQQVYNETYHDWLTFATVTIREAGQYRARLCITTSGECVEELITTDSPRIALRSINDQELLFDIHSPGDKNDYFLASCSDQQLIELKEVSGTTMAMNMTTYPAGVIYFFLLDDRGMIRSNRSVYHYVKDLPLQASDSRARDSISIASNGDFYTLEVAIAANTKAHDVHAFVVPEETVSGNYTLSHMSPETVNDLLLFKASPVIDKISVFNEKSALPITYSRGDGVKDPAPPARKRIGPIELMMSGLYDKARLDSIVVFRKKIARIRATYQLPSMGKYQRIPADASYAPGDYPTLKNSLDFVSIAIPRLKKRTTEGTTRFHFFYTNLKDQKQLYESPAAVVVNGYRIPDFSFIRDLPLTEMEAVDVIYNSGTLMKSRLASFFPSGAVAVTLNERSLFAAGLAERFRLFSFPFAWPHEFPVGEPLPATPRIPFFSSVYYWNPRLKPRSGKTMFSCKLPPPSTAHAFLYAFSLASVKADSYLIQKY